AHGVINNMLEIVIDPARLSDMAQLKAEIEAVVAYFKASPPADKKAPVLVPRAWPKASPSTRPLGASSNQPRIPSASARRNFKPWRSRDRGPAPTKSRVAFSRDHEEAGGGQVVVAHRAEAGGEAALGEAVAAAHRLVGHDREAGGRNRGAVR